VGWRPAPPLARVYNKEGSTPPECAWLPTKNPIFGVGAGGRFLGSQNADFGALYDGVAAGEQKPLKKFYISHREEKNHD